MCGIKKIFNTGFRNNNLSSLQKVVLYAIVFSMNTITHSLPYIQIFLAFLLIIVIVFQRSGEGMEGALGGTASTMSRSARRGGEKALFFVTIIIAILFVVSAVVSILLS
jgi:protein translocase SecG subunit